MSKSIFLLLFPLSLMAAPSGGKVVHGDAKVAQRGANLTEVRQESSKAVVEWDSFSLAADEIARFVQPSSSSATLNRVVGGNLSEIYGRMEGNGHIFLVNPNGVLIGETGRINCSGFIASGLDVDQQSFLSGKPLVLEDGMGTVVNQGKIDGRDGKVYLIGADVKNSGKAAATQGVYIQIGNSPNVVVRTSVSQLEQSGDNLYALAVNQDAVKEAPYVRKELGRVFLEERVSEAPAFTLVDVPNVPFANGGLYVGETLYSLQQLWSVIPERLWYQRFAILLNQSRFKAAVKGYAARPLLIESDPIMGFGTSSYYSLQNTVSGDPIGMSDDYVQFLNSPYWKTPDELLQLNNLQNKAFR